MAIVCFALGACAEAVALVATLGCYKFDVISFGYLPANIFQYLACLLPSCHSQSSNLNVIGIVNQYLIGFPFTMAG